MAPYYLAAHVRYCALDSGAVVLDIRRQKYLGLESRARDAIEAATCIDPAKRMDSLSDRSLREQVNALVQAGILTNNPCNVQQSPVIVPVTDSLAETAELRSLTRVTSRDIVHFAASASRVAWEFKWSALEKITERLQQRKLRLGEERAVTRTVVTRQVLKYETLRLWVYSAAGRCLLDSLMLADFLLRQRVPVTVMLGVSTKPFCAHAWVQWNDIALNSSTSEIARYTPIMAI